MYLVAEIHSSDSSRAVFAGRIQGLCMEIGAHMARTTTHIAPPRSASGGHWSVRHGWAQVEKWDHAHLLSSSLQAYSRPWRRGRPGKRGR